MPEETIDALKHFHRRREARLRQRLAATDDLVGKYWILKFIYRNRKFEKQFLQKYLDIGGKSSTIKLPITEADGGPGSGNHGHKGVPGQVGGSAPSGPAKELSEAISTGRVSTKLNKKKQSKHTKGSPAYEKAVKAGQKVSVMYLSDADVQALVSQYSGKGHIRISKGQIRETFEHTSPIGVHVNIFGKEAETTRGTIHYSKSGAHIVPSSPKK